MKFEQWLGEILTKAGKRLIRASGDLQTDHELKQTADAHTALRLQMIEQAHTVVWLLADRLPRLAAHSSHLNLTPQDKEIMRETLRNTSSFQSLKTEMAERFGAYPADGDWLEVIEHDPRRYRSLSGKGYPAQSQVFVLVPPFAQVSQSIPRGAKGLVLAEYEVINLLTATPSFSGTLSENTR